MTVEMFRKILEDAIKSNKEFMAAALKRVPKARQ
jgi:hypothetical protein